MISNFTLLISPIIALVLALISGPFLRKAAFKFNFTDQPNLRKVHKTPIPLIGGILVFISAALTLSLTLPSFKEFDVLISGTFFLLLMGIIDDKLDLKAGYKFILQICLAYFVFASGIRIESLFGIFGIYTLPISVQLVLTIIVITGTINAINLTDGIDGLAAGIAVLGLSAYTVLALLMNLNGIALISLSLIGALLGFLKFNLSSETKIFMGDAGSLFLGYIMVVLGIQLIQAANSPFIHSNAIYLNQALTIVISVLLIPVIDSLRVYRGRIKSGKSMFNADKTHLHHLLLMLTIKHFKASGIIVLLSVIFILLAFFMSQFFSLSFILFTLLLLFALFSNLMNLNKELVKWSEKIKSLEIP